MTTLSTEKWIGGTVGLTWTDVAGGTGVFNGLVAGNALAGADLDNGTNLDVLADVSIQLASITPVAPNYVGLFLYPRNQDDSTFGDGRFGTSAAGPPPTSYWIDNIPVVTGGAAVQQGTVRGILLPPGHFKFVFYNNCGVNWGNSNVLKYRTYDRQQFA